MRIPTKLLRPDAVLPRKATPGSAAYDLFVPGDDLPYWIPIDGSVVIPTGLAFQIPEDYVLKVYSRSGHGFKHNVTLANSVGIIDSDYRGELKVKLTMESSRDNRPLRLDPGKAIAQATLIRRWDMDFDVVDNLDDTERGEGGFGSTG